ncbi:MAG: hypothetical protein IKD74_02295 [Clostridia bacterium]|nr:hypothetical protein [Clostridia bacterium]
MNQDSEKLLIYITVAIFAVAFIFVLVLIWKPSSSTVKTQINVIGKENSYENVQLSNYTNLIQRLLLVQNYDELYEKVNTKWLENNSYNKETLYNYLIKEGIITNSVPIIKETTALDGNAEGYYFRIAIQNEKGNIRYVVINETAPNIYTISFEQNSITSFEGKTYTYKEDGITYTLKVLASLENVAQYELNISSTKENKVTFDFASNQNVTIGLTGGQNINPSDMTTTANNVYELGPNSNLSIKLTFNLTLDKQAKISNLKLYSVKESGEDKIITIDLLGGDQ